MKQHPIIKELEVNEDGTEIVYKGKLLEVRAYHKKGRNNYVQRNVHFFNRTHSVAKLVCECYHGMRTDMSFTTQRKDFNPDNDHYTNLFWGKKGGRIRTERTKRNKNSKIKDSDIPVIVKRIDKGETLESIAKSYGTSIMTMLRVKKRYVTNPRLVFKEAVLGAKNKNEIKTICAKYLKYPSTSVAIQQMGRFEFDIEVDKLITGL